MYNGIPIKQKTSVKYLGSIIDHTISGLEMATNAIKKINAGIKFMYREQGYLGYKSENNYVCLCFSHDLTTPAIFGLGVFLNMLQKNYRVVKTKL